jgi:hypothetical protein
MRCSLSMVPQINFRSVEVRCLRVAPGLLQADQDMPDAPWAKIGDINWLGSDEVDLISRPRALFDHGK